MSMDVYLRKEKVGSIEESNLFDFRLLCEQVGYQTDVLKNSLYVRPWLEGKRLVIDLQDGENETEDLKCLRDYASRLPFLDMMQSILSAYGLETYILPEPHFPSQIDRRSRMVNKAGGDLYLLMQANPMVSKNRIHLWYGYSSLKQSKSLADCLYASLHALEQANVQKPSLLWNPWSSRPYNNLLKEINMPGVVIKYLYADEDENDERNVRQFASALCQGVLAYFQVPVLSPSIHQPEIWELVAKYVFKIPLAENGKSQGNKHFPHEEESREDKSQSSPVPVLGIVDQEAVSSLPVEELEQNPIEKSEHRQIEMDFIPEQFEKNEPSEIDLAAESFFDKEGTKSSTQEEISSEEYEADDKSRVLTLISSLSEEEHGQSAADSSEESIKESDPVPVPSQDIPQPKQQQSAPSLSTTGQRPPKTDPADPWAKLATLPHWNHSSLMRPNQPSNNTQQGVSQTSQPFPFAPHSNRAPRHAQALSQNSFPADAAEINPFARRNVPSSTVDPFKPQRPNR